MSADTPQTNLWLERSRLAGMVLAAVSYGGFFVLTVQAISALMQRPRHGGKIAENRRWLLFYVLITFVLGTVGFAGNARYTEMIWIDLRDKPGGPAWLIENELNYHINIVAVACYYMMECFMQILLLCRCCIMWNWSRYIMIPMITLIVGMIVLPIMILIQASTGLVWYNINIVLIYLSIDVGFTLMYTILVTSRLLVMRHQMKQTMERYSSIYDTIVFMIVESAMLYTPLAILFIISFALHSDISNLCFLGITHIQGIAQLLIIIRVAKGRSITQEWSSGVAVAPTSIAFNSGTAIDLAEESNLEQITSNEPDISQLLSVKTEVV